MVPHSDDRSMLISPRPAGPASEGPDNDEPRRLATGQRHTIVLSFEVTGVAGPPEIRIDPSASHSTPILYTARTTTPPVGPAQAGRIRWVVQDAVNNNPFPGAGQSAQELPRGSSLSTRVPIEWAGKRIRAIAFVERERRERSAVTQVLLTAPYLTYDGREICWYSERNQVAKSWPMPGSPGWRGAGRPVSAGKWRVQVGANALHLTPWNPRATPPPASTIQLGSQAQSFTRVHSQAASKPALLIASQPDELWITAEHLRQIMGARDEDIARYLLPLNRTLHRYEINTRLRQAHFLAQVAHETARLRSAKEYASGAAYEPTTSAGRIVGNTQPGDGPRFKGRGLIHLTGRPAYAAYGAYRGTDLVSGTNPDRVETDPELACDVAGWFWTYGKHKSTPGAVRFNVLADADDVRTISLYVNGGFNGYAERQSFLRIAKQVLGVR